MTNSPSSASNVSYGDDRRMPIAHPRRRLAGREVDAGLVGEERGRRVEHRDVDLLPAAGSLAREEREGDALDGEHAADDIGDRDAETIARPVGGPVMLISPPSACTTAS